MVGICELRPIRPHACEKAVDEFGPCFSLNWQKLDTSCSVKRFFNMLWVSSAFGTIHHGDGHAEAIETIPHKERSFRDGNTVKVSVVSKIIYEKVTFFSRKE